MAAVAALLSLCFGALSPCPGGVGSLCKGVLATGPDNPKRISVSVDDKYAAVAALSSGVHVYDVATGAAVTMPVYAPAHDVAFSPDTDKVAVARRAYGVAVASRSSGTEVWSDTSKGLSYSVVYSHDGTHLASGGDHEIHIWTADGVHVRALTGGHSGGVHGLSFTPDGEKLVSVSSDKSVVVWNAKTGANLKTLTDHTSDVHVTHVSPDGAYFASLGTSDTVNIYKLSDYSLHKQIEFKAEVPLADGMSFSKDWSKVVVEGFGADGMKVYSTDTGALLGRPVMYPSTGTCTASYFHTSDTIITADDHTKRMILWGDVATPAPPTPLPPTPAPQPSATPTPDTPAPTVTLPPQPSSPATPTPQTPAPLTRTPTASPRTPAPETGVPAAPTVNLTVADAETPLAPSSVRTTVAAATVAAVGFAGGVGSTSTGAMVSIYSAVGMSRRCDEGVPETSPVVNPLTQRVGAGAYAAHMGAVVFVAVVCASLCAVVGAVYAALRWYFWRCTGRPPTRTEDTRILGRARVGWLAVPFAFLYASIAPSAFMIAWHGSEHRWVGMLLVVALAVLWLFVVAVVTVASQRCCCIPVEGSHSLWVRMFTGTQEWAPRTDDGSRTEADNQAWMGVWFAVFDAYTWESRYFLLWELAAAVVLGALQTIQAHSEGACLGRASGVGAVVLVLLAKVVYSRPFLTLFENVGNALLLAGELLVVALSIAHTETGEDAAEAAADVLSEIVTWGMVAQFVVCMAMFISARYAEWCEDTGKHGVLRFAAHWLCFTDVLVGLVDPADMKELPVSVPEDQHMHNDLNHSYTFSDHNHNHDTIQEVSTDTHAAAVCPLLPAAVSSGGASPHAPAAEEACPETRDGGAVWSPAYYTLPTRLGGVVNHQSLTSYLSAHSARQEKRTSFNEPQPG